VHKSRDLAKRFDVRGVPKVVRIVSSGSVRVFEGKRDAAHLEAFAKGELAGSAMPWLTGPFGPRGRAIALYTKCSDKLLQVYERILANGAPRSVCTKCIQILECNAAVNTIDCSCAHAAAATAVAAYRLSATVRSTLCQCNLLAVCPAVHNASYAANETSTFQCINC
jgi:hypothetical protein